MTVEYNELFNLCGLDDEWQAENKGRIEKFLDRIEIRTQAEMDHALEFTKLQYDTSLLGVRMCLAVCVKETIDWVLARDEREVIISYGRPTMGVLSMGLATAENRLNEEAGYTKYYARGTSILMSEIIVGTVFDKTNALIEIGEDMGQTAGRGHCSEFQVWEGGLVKGYFPTPDLELSCGVFCDQAPEAEALLADEFDYPVIFTDMPLDSQWKTWPDIDKTGIEFMATNTDRAYNTLRRDFNFPLTEEDLSNGAVSANVFVGRHMGITTLMAAADPQPLSQADVALSFWLYVLGTVYVDEASAAMKQMTKDVRARIKAGEGVVPKGAPRVYMTMRPVTDFRVYKLLEEVGIAVPLCWFDMFPPEVTGTDTKFEDRPAAACYEMIFRFCGMGDLYGSTLNAFKWMAEEYGLDGMILVNLICCRPYSLPTNMAKDYLNKELEELPTIIVEMDAFDSRNYTPGQIRTRLESFAEVLRMNQAMKEIQEVTAS